MNQEENLLTENLLTEVKLGIEAEYFLRSDLGKYIIKKVNEERENAIEELVKTYPKREGIEKIIELQNAVYRADSLQTWLAEAIQNGFYAEEQLKIQDEV